MGKYKRMRKKQIRFNIDRGKHINQIIDKPLYLSIKEKLHINNSYEKYYVGFGDVDKYMNEENEVYIITKTNIFYGFFVYDAWSYNNIMKNISSIRKYSHFLQKIYFIKKNSDFSIGEKKTLCKHIQDLLNLLLLIETEYPFHINIQRYIFDYDLITTNNLKCLISDIINVAQIKIDTLKNIINS